MKPDDQLLAIKPSEIKRVILVVEDRGGLAFSDLIQAVAHVYGVDAHAVANKINQLVWLEYEKQQGGDAIQ
jgi:hypothetical protein